MKILIIDGNIQEIDKFLYSISSNVKIMNLKLSEKLIISNIQ